MAPPEGTPPSPEEAPKRWHSERARLRLELNDAIERLSRSVNKTIRWATAILIGFLGVAVAILSQSNKPRPADVPRASKVADARVAEALESILPQNLTPKERKAVGAAALDKLRDDFANDPTGERTAILREWILASELPLERPDTAKRQRDASSKIVPYFRHAVEWGLEVCELPAETRKTAKNLLTKMGEAAVSEVAKRLTGAFLDWLFKKPMDADQRVSLYQTIVVRCDTCGPGGGRPSQSTERIFHYHFDLDSHEVNPGRLRAILLSGGLAPTEAWRMTWVLRGHTDHLGSNAYNESLAARRVMKVQDELKRLGARRIEIHSFGEDNPPVETHEDASLPDNRVVHLEARQDGDA